MNAYCRRTLTFIVMTVLFVCVDVPRARAGEACTGPRIIDATLVPQEQFPTVGQIGSTSKADFCTGTLIAPRFVLIAAHCVNEQVPGSLSFGQKDGVFVLNKKTYHTSHIYVHPSYAGDNSQQKEGAIDLAIFELDQDVKKVTPTPLYRKTPVVGTVLTMAGFGLLGTGSGGVGSDVPPKGQIATGKTPIDIVTNTFIKWNFNNVPPPNQESNTAPGDSGGPQFITENDTLFLASVTSGGVKNNASFGDLAYNTRVDIALPWIESITGGTPVEKNHAPVIASLDASALGVLAGTPLTFTTAASDADSDPLQYHWIFGDGTETIDGAAAETHTFIDEGTYLVQLVVTDKKDGSTARTVTVAALNSDPLSTPLTPATFVKKSFSLDFSGKDKGSAIDVTIQSPDFKFADEAAFQAAFPKNTFTTLYIGNTSIRTAFGPAVKEKTVKVAYDYKKGTLRFQFLKNLTDPITPALNFYGAANADTKATITVPISFEILRLVGGSTTVRYGGTAEFMYAAKKNSAGKGK